MTRIGLSLTLSPPLVNTNKIVGVTGATAGGIIAILKQKPVGGYAFSGGLNASLFGMTFIGNYLYLGVKDQAIGERRRIPKKRKGRKAGCGINPRLKRGHGHMLPYSVLSSIPRVVPSPPA